MRPIAQPALKTARLTLRPLAADDGRHLADIFASAEVRRYLFDNQEVPAESIAPMVAENLQRGELGLGLWLVVSDDSVIGCVALQQLSPQSAAAFPALAGEIEPIIALKPAHWGAGLAEEALQAVVVYARDVLKLKRIVALVDAPNRASRALMERCGFAGIGSGQGPVYELVACERPFN